MGGFGDKRLRDFLPVVDAYRPVALTVAAILVLVMVVPGAARDGGTGGADDFATAPAVSAGGAETPVAGREAAPPASTTPAPRRQLGGATPVSAPPVRPVTIPSAPPSSGGADAPGSPTTDGAGPGDGLGDDLGTDDADEPLRIVATGWASTTGGTPLASSETEGVPEGTLPVGTRVGQPDKVSFVRLAGTETSLVLAEDAAGRRGSAFEAPPVELCPITDEQWEEGAAQPMSAAPAHDPERCVAAQQRSDGTWAFDLVAFEDPADARGFALVPSAEAPIDFQITFAGQAIA